MSESKDRDNAVLIAGSVVFAALVIAAVMLYIHLSR